MLRSAIPSTWIFSAFNRVRSKALICTEASNTPYTLSGLSSAAIRLMDKAPHSGHSWMSINSPWHAPYFFQVALTVNPTGFIGDLQAERRSPAACRSRWRDHRQYGQWFRFLTPLSWVLEDTGLLQCLHRKPSSAWLGPKRARFWKRFCGFCHLEVE